MSKKFYVQTKFLPNIGLKNYYWLSWTNVKLELNLEFIHSYNLWRINYVNQYSNVNHENKNYLLFRQHNVDIEIDKIFFSMLEIYYGRECRLWRRIFLQSNPLSRVIYHFLYNNKCDLYHLSRSRYYLNTTNVVYNYKHVKT